MFVDVKHSTKSPLFPTISLSHSAEMASLRLLQKRFPMHYSSFHIYFKRLP